MADVATDEIRPTQVQQAEPHRDEGGRRARRSELEFALLAGGEQFELPRRVDGPAQGEREGGAGGQAQCLFGL